MSLDINSNDNTNKNMYINNSKNKNIKTNKVKNIKYTKRRTSNIDSVSVGGAMFLSYSLYCPSVCGELVILIVLVLEALCF